MKNPRIFTLHNIAILLFEIQALNILISWIVKSGCPFYIRLVSTFLLTFFVLTDIILFVGFLIHVFSKKSKENTVE